MNVFISYRRDDTQWPARQLYEELSKSLPKNQIFIDVDSIPVGVDFQDEITSWISQCGVFLALIGSKWLATSGYDPATSRLLNPADLVRVEIGTALEKNVMVIPVFIDGAKAPDNDALPASLRPLLARNGAVLNLRTFENDVSSLLSQIQRAQEHQVRLESDTSVTHSRNTVPDLDADAQLILSFLEAWPTWGFTPKRILNWGSQQTGYASLSDMSRDTLSKTLQHLVEVGAIRTRVSGKQNILYQALRK